MTSPKLNYLPKDPPPNTIALGIMASTKELWGRGTTIWSIGGDVQDPGKEKSQSDGTCSGNHDQSQLFSHPPALVGTSSRLGTK